MLGYVEGMRLYKQDMSHSSLHTQNNTISHLSSLFFIFSYESITHNFFGRL